MTADEKAYAEAKAKADKREAENKKNGVGNVFFDKR